MKRVDNVWLVNLPEELRRALDSLLKEENYIIEPEKSPTILIVGAGLGVSSMPLMDAEPGSWLAEVQRQFLDLFHAIQITVPAMEGGGRGKVIVVTTDVGICGALDSSVAGAISAGVISATRSFARELAPRGIIVNAICGGTILREAADTKSTQITLADPWATAVATIFAIDQRLRSLVGQVIVCNDESTRSRT